MFALQVLKMTGDSVGYTILQTRLSQAVLGKAKKKKKTGFGRPQI